MSEEKMSAYSCGTEVMINLGLHTGIITGISIRYKNVSYEITYYHDGEYKILWCNEKEFATAAEKKIKIGYVR